jgi:predicted nicotinamide N-methyase
MTAVPGHAPPAAIRPSAAEIQSPDPFAFLAVLPPGGRRSPQQLLELARLAAGPQVLDIGCGVATTTIQVAQRFNAQVTAADLAPLMLARANRNVVGTGLDGHVTVSTPTSWPCPTPTAPSTGSSPRPSPCSWTGPGPPPSWPASAGPAGGC